MMLALILAAHVFVLLGILWAVLVHGEYVKLEARCRRLQRELETERRITTGRAG